MRLLKLAYSLPLVLFLFRLPLVLFLLSGCLSTPLPVSECQMARNEGPLIRPDTNPGRSLVIRPDPATIVNAASLAMITAGENSPVGRGTVLEIGGGDEDSEVTTITLTNRFLDFPVPFAAWPGMARAQALMEWGLGGIQAQALVDYQHGLSFSVPASWIRVTGINAPLPAVDPINGIPLFGRNIEVGAFCTYGTVGKNGPLSAKLTHFIDVLVPPLGGVLIPVPRFATNFLFIPGFTGAPTGSAIVSLNNEQNVSVSFVSVPPGAANQGNLFPNELPNSIYSLLITNLEVVNSMGGVIIFGISI